MLSEAFAQARTTIAVANSPLQFLESPERPRPALKNQLVAGMAGGGVKTACY